MAERIELGEGWHLLRVEVGDSHEWIICDPAGDRLGNTPKHKAELDAALMRSIARIRAEQGRRNLGAYYRAIYGPLG
jgi:hypothetical protein